MTYHHRLAAPRIIAPGGPVSAALQTMQAAEPASDRQALRDLRASILRRVAADLGMIERIERASRLLSGVSA